MSKQPAMVFVRDGDGQKKPLLVWLICLVLVATTLALYWPVRSYGFVRIDDPDYVSENPQVHQGVSISGLIWAFRSNDASNWHPLTWFSHMVDYELFGGEAGGPHLVNVILHSANGALLFLFLFRSTGYLWRSAIVAASFGWHPLRVESVAWIAERKDVLSSFFALLVLIAYGNYARAERAHHSSRAGNSHERRGIWYALALVFYALGLLSKPMLVTIPCVLMLLDFWPWHRIAQDDCDRPSGLKQILLGMWRLLPEKIPFLLLSVISCALTFWAQSAGHSIGSTQHFPMQLRVANALSALGKYVVNTVWPSNLAVFYPYPAVAPLMEALSTAVALTVVVWLAIRWLEVRPWWIVGWLWFVGMLVPVIGLVQVGGQSWADRYSYLPSVGLVLVLVWTAVDLASRWRSARVLGPAALILLGVWAFRTRQQVGVWRNTQTLFEHARLVTRSNYFAWTALGDSLLRQGDLSAANRYFETALQMQPEYAGALSGLGSVHEKLGEYEVALGFYDRALAVSPYDAEIVNGRAAVLARQGKYSEAEAGFKKAIAMRSGYGEAIFNLAGVLDKQGRLAEALAQFQEAASLMPESSDVHIALGEALRRAQKPAEALQAYDQSLKLAPGWTQARYGRALAMMEVGRLPEAGAEFKALTEIMTNRAPALDGYGFVLAMQGQTAEAERLFKEAMSADPHFANAQTHYAMMLAQRGDLPDAVIHYRQALKLDPNQPGALNNVAWLLATHPDDTLRDGAEAVRYAQRACELTGHREPFFLGTLAAAYAETRDFPKAIATAELAKAIARKAGRSDLAQRNEDLLKFYRSGQPFRDAPQTR